MLLPDLGNVLVLLLMSTIAHKQIAQFPPIIRDPAGFSAVIGKRGKVVEFS